MSGYRCAQCGNFSPYGGSYRPCWKHRLTFLFRRIAGKSYDHP